MKWVTHAKGFHTFHTFYNVHVINTHGGGVLYSILSSLRPRSLHAADSRGDEPPDLENKAAPLAPIATFDEGGIVLWDEKVKHEINRLATTPTSTRCRSRQ